MVRVKALAGVAAAAALATAADPAAAQSLCEQREAFLMRLAQTQAEAPIAIGLSATGSVIEVLASRDGNFTILVTTPSGTTCLVAHGEGWHAIGTDAKPQATL
ncbi:MAG: hypothetical protein FJX61_09205 [Alphaproteobacteria bacterium]|nr:hypothetical protein [Alphaproteobacteria bacterium]